MNQSQQQAQVNTESHTATTPDSQCIYTNTGNQASSTPSIAETHPIQAPVPGVHVTSQPEKMTESTKLIPEFQSGKVDAKKFRPRYYDINSLEIGTWRVSLPYVLKIECCHFSSKHAPVCWKWNPFFFGGGGGGGGRGDFGHVLGNRFLADFH